MGQESHHRHSLVLAASGSLLAISSSADGTWTKNATGTQNWVDTANSSSGTVADGADSTAFLSDAISRDPTITLDTDGTIGNIHAWNEFGEGGIVAPTKGNGTMMLDAISEVLGE